MESKTNLPESLSHSFEAGEISQNGFVLSDVSAIIDNIFQRIKQYRSDACLPFVTLSFAQSIDGSIATSKQECLHLSNPETLRMTHSLRAMHGSILVGINTVLADNPRLNVRLVSGPDPVPVVVDTHLRLPLSARMLRISGPAPIIITSALADPKKQVELEKAGATIIRVSQQPDGKLDFREILLAIGKRGINSVMIEGGAEIISSILSQNLADHLVITICPMMVGGLGCFNNNDKKLKPLNHLSTAFVNGDLVIAGELQK